MPNPKRRHSNTRTRKRRTHDKMSVAQTHVCAHCQSMGVLTFVGSHRVCPKCGTYKGRPVLAIKTKDKKKSG